MKIGLLIRLAGVCLLIFLLILIRKYESILFYDPFLEYFKQDFQNLELPNYVSLKMYGYLAFRYILNAILSILIIQLLFWKKNFTKIALQVYAVVGILLLFIYILMIEFNFPFGYLSVFYIRRFLIQPLLLLILIPAFYYLYKKN